ncbi:MAG TPA: hypothetical protein VIX19_15745 [Terriglobales bacterium]
MIYGSEATCKVTLLALYCTEKCSLLLMLVPFTVENVPLRELQVRILKLPPTAGMNPPRSPILSVPFSIASPLTLSWLNWLAAAMLMSKTPCALWV